MCAQECQEFIKDSDTETHKPGAADGGSRLT